MYMSAADGNGNQETGDINTTLTASCHLGALPARTRIMPPASAETARPFAEVAMFAFTLLNLHLESCHGAAPARGARRRRQPGCDASVGVEQLEQLRLRYHRVGGPAAADAMVSSGMRDAGYRYVVVDDCWFDPQRDARGNLRAHPSKVPSGTK